MENNKKFNISFTIFSIIVLVVFAESTIEAKVENHKDYYRHENLQVMAPLSSNYEPFENLVENRNFQTFSKNGSFSLKGTMGQLLNSLHGPAEAKYRHFGSHFSSKQQMTISLLYFPDGHQSTSGIFQFRMGNGNFIWFLSLVNNHGDAEVTMSLFSKTGQGLSGKLVKLPNFFKSWHWNPITLVIDAKSQSMFLYGINGMKQLVLPTLTAIFHEHSEQYRIFNTFGEPIFTFKNTESQGKSYVTLAIGRFITLVPVENGEFHWSNCERLVQSLKGRDSIACLLLYDIVLPDKEIDHLSKFCFSQ